MSICLVSSKMQSFVNNLLRRSHDFDFVMVFMNYFRLSFAHVPNDHLSQFNSLSSSRLAYCFHSHKHWVKASSHHHNSFVAFYRFQRTIFLLISFLFTVLLWIICHFYCFLCTIFVWCRPELVITASLFSVAKAKKKHIKRVCDKKPKKTIFRFLFFYLRKWS